MKKRLFLNAKYILIVFILTIFSLFKLCNYSLNYTSLTKEDLLMRHKINKLFLAKAKLKLVVRYSPTASAWWSLAKIYKLEQNLEESSFCLINSYKLEPYNINYLLAFWTSKIESNSFNISDKDIEIAENMLSKVRADNKKQILKVLSLYFTDAGNFSAAKQYLHQLLVIETDTDNKNKIKKILNNLENKMR